MAGVRSLLAVAAAACCLALAAALPAPCTDRCWPTGNVDVANQTAKPSWRIGGVSIGQKKFCNTADLNGIMPSIRDGGCPTDQQIMDAVHNKAVTITIMNITSEDGNPRLTNSLWDTEALTVFACAYEDCAIGGSSDATVAKVSDAVNDVVNSMDWCWLANDNVVTMQVAIESAKTFEGAPVRDAGMDPEDTPIGAADGEGGATFEVVLAHPDVLAKRGYPQHMLAIIGNSAYANEVGANQCVLETAPKGTTPGAGAAGRTSWAAGLAAVAAAALAGLAAPLLL
ncbi:hypothetical protein COHA_008849 [Chlorella ohadii]|uniref:Uncharacterized protein n=1 Tax=Chlorella ohadii TaxID=2649997 RepID=A0AAD5GYN1_9CHLO|nr:hypothetical protein COHA_008849 [Chlorella ohadii]